MNQAVIETVQTLCRKGNRDSVLTVFQNFPEHFSCIPLNDSNVESKQAINDLLRENVILNGVKFFSGHGELFLESLRQVVEILSKSPAYKGGRTGSEIVERVLCKASRTTSGSDSYFTVQQLFTNSDYLLKKRSERPPAINVEVFLVDNSIHSVVACANYYGLFSLDEIEAESQTFAVHTPRAWLRLDTMVVEKTDYLTGRNVRYLRVDTPDLPSSQQQSQEQGEGGAGAGGGGGTAAAAAAATAAGAGSGAVAHTPPPRENGEVAFSSGGGRGSGGGGGGGGSGGGRSGLGSKTSPGNSGWAPAPANLSPNGLFGDTAASASASAP